MAASLAARRARLLGGSAVALVAALSGRALALDECGPGAPGGTVTCTPAGNSFPNGIQYKVDDLTIVIEDGVVIDTTTKAGEPGGIASGGNGDYGSLTVKAGTAAGGGVIIITDANDAEGIEASTDKGDVAITFNGRIATSGSAATGVEAFSKEDGDVSVVGIGTISTAGNNAIGLFAEADDGSVSVTWTGGITTAGNMADAIRVDASGDISVLTKGDVTAAAGYGIRASAAAGAITIDSTGDIRAGQGDGIAATTDGTVTITSIGDVTTSGADSAGIYAISHKDDVSITTSGDISTLKINSAGIAAVAEDDAAFVTSTGDITTLGASSQGIVAAALKEGVIISHLGDIVTSGLDSTGISAYSKMDAVLITSTGNLATSGLNAGGIAGFGSSVGIVHTGAIVTTGDESRAISATAKTDSVDIKLSGSAITSGEDSTAIYAQSVNATVSITASGLVRASGESAHGIEARGKDDVDIEAENVIATGRYANGIFIRSLTDNKVTVSGAVLGGWDGGIGIFFDSETKSSLTINAGGSVTALTDTAIVQSDDNLTLENDGAIIGSFLLNDGDDKLLNDTVGIVVLRQFADIDGNLARDKEGVAIGDFADDADSFINAGVLSLGRADGATMWDTTGQIAHPGGGNSDITQEGIEQGFLLGLETFTHSGLITLQDGVAGDLLVITDQADGKTKGANVFTSDSGSLALDVVLDDGSSKQSDVLILDKAVTGTGATRVSIANAGGLGGQTTGDGILVINVRDTSDADAFASAGPAIAGAYEYDLVFQNAAKTDQNWYLQSSFFEGSLEYPAISSGALATWQSGLGGLGDQLRKRRALVAEQDAAIGQVAELPNTATDIADASSVRVKDGGGNAGWFQVSGADMDIEQSGAADFDLNTVRAEAGVDVGFNDLIGAEDWLVAGAFAGYGWSSVGFDSGSEIDFDIATVGAYATYFRGPYYLDALVKLDWLDGSFNSESVSEDGDLSLPVFGFSLESGYRFDLTPGGLYVQPQAQLSFAHAGGDSFTDDSGAEIALEDADSLRGRLGARIGQELATTAGAAAEPVRGNFYLEAAVNQ
jgi:outer membrane autotransporter protein